MIDVNAPEKYQTDCGDDIVAIYRAGTGDGEYHVTAVETRVPDPLRYYSFDTSEADKDIIPKQEWEYQGVNKTGSVSAWYKDLDSIDKTFWDGIIRRPKGSLDPAEWERCE